MIQRKSEITKLVNWIETELSYIKEKEANTGSIYLSLEGLPNIRISDHIGHKNTESNEAIQIITPVNNKSFVVVYNKNLLIYEKVSDIKSFLLSFKVIKLIDGKVYQNFLNQISELQEALRKRNKEIAIRGKTIKDLHEKLANEKKGK